MNQRTLTNPNAVPRELWPYKQFTCWKYVDRGPDHKPVKVPINCATLGNAGSTYPNTWTDIRSAVATYQANPDLAGLSFVLTETDPYAMVDLDTCVQSGVPNDFAAMIVDRLATYTEYSPSCNGLRLLVRDEVQRPALKRPEIEVYSSQRFATLTGNVLVDEPIVSADLTWLYELFPKPTANSDPQLSSSCAERVAPTGDDAALWEYIFRINSLAQPIYNGDLSNVRRNKDGKPDPSHAAILLLNSLALWTNGDAGRMDRMIRQTHLDQSKWNENRKGQTWLDGRIGDAINYVGNRGAR